jgi:hypothetical protein
MKGLELRRGRSLRRAVQLTAATLAIAGTGAVSGCLTRPLQSEDTRTTSTFVNRLTESAVDKIDLLLTIDNSRSMADKQQILVQAVPDLVKGLVNPKCVDPTGVAAPVEVPTATEACPAGLKRDFNPVVDIHIGIVTSSIGGHGADSCPNEETQNGCPSGAVNTTNNDKGHLIYRKDPCATALLPTYNDKGFLAWDPKAHDDPPGEAAIGEVATTTNPDGTVNTITPGLVASLKDMVLGAGQVGCGYEAQMEGWYRFLVDPDPYEKIEVIGQKATPSGTDNILIQQRKDFLRPSSLLAIIGLTDENDCSIKEYGQFYLAAQQKSPTNPSQDFHLPLARKECETNPNDPCCLSCAQAAPASCPSDPAVSGCTGNRDPKTDDLNLRCWDQKRRFGIDFLYPIDRYVAGLRDAQVPDRTGQMKQNPIFTDLDPADNDSNIRSSDLVFMAFIAGVPWQDIARQDATGKPDLLNGLDADGKAVGGFKSASELNALDKNGHTTWDYIVGDPANFVPPLDPHMIESTAPRMGTNPITGDVIAPTTAPAGTDAINGHEYTVGTQNGVQVTPNDLEYACIFPLPNSRDCTLGGACDCGDPKNDNPLCEPDPNHGGNRTLQVRAKAYPGIRELTLIKSLGQQGIVGSICPAQLTNRNSNDFGYRPAIGAIIDRLKIALGGQCLPRKLKPNASGQVQCLILEAKNTNNVHKFTSQGGDCDAWCDSTTEHKARKHVTNAKDVAAHPELQLSDQTPAVTAALADPSAASAHWDCFCEIEQLARDTTAQPPMCGAGSSWTNASAANELDVCQCDATDAPQYNGAPVDGWCYVDATASPQLGNEQIVKNCSESERRLVRFVGGGNPAAGSTLFITCAGD